MSTLNKIFSSLLILTLLPHPLLAAAPPAAPGPPPFAIYKSKEANGVLSFSDQPTTHSTEVPLTSLATLNTFSVPTSRLAPAHMASLENTNQNGTTTQTNSTQKSYTVNIISPAANTIFQLASAPYSATVTTSPTITAQDSVKPVLSIYNGNIVDQSQLAQTLDKGTLNEEGSWNFSIPNLNVGTQLLSVNVINKQDNTVLGTSSPIQVFYKPPMPMFHTGSFAGK